jgi:hypothetical protein
VRLFHYHLSIKEQLLQYTIYIVFSQIIL